MGGPEVATYANPGKPISLRVREVEVEVLNGPEAGRKARASTPTFIVGTGEGADLRLTDVKVSRHHFSLTLGEDSVRLRDDSSKNGTWLGAVRVSGASLSSETIVLVGDTKLAVRLEARSTDLPISPNERFGKAIGVSLSLRHVFAVLERAAQSDISVLLEGESGVGKDVLAHAVHDASKRCDGPFVAVDCGALPETLVESELFGHEKGAFTGAERAQPGLFAQADKGTLFLDEIGELPLEAQAKLLRVLETREVRAVGAQKSRKIDVRIIAATNRRLAEDSQRGEFRKDLYYRIATAKITVPALRDRTEDILPLATAFLRMMSGKSDAELPPDLLALFLAYTWPGNVRELRNVVERHAFLGARDARSLFDAPAAGEEQSEAGGSDLSGLPYQDARRVAIDRFERTYLTRVLERFGGIVVRAAEHAGVTRPSFYRMLERAGVPIDKR